MLGRHEEHGLRDRVSYVVTDVADDNGYMDALGETQTAKVKGDRHAEGVAMHEAGAAEGRRAVQGGGRRRRG